MPDALFHLAIPVDDLQAARGFYGGLLGCPEGRSDPHWIDFDFHGHQLVVHLAPARAAPAHSNDVDGDHVPVPHFGLVLDWPVWEALAAKLTAAGTDFVVEPHVRFQGRVGEQATMFFHDPAGNALEFKAFKNHADIFAKFED